MSIQLASNEKRGLYAGLIVAVVLTVVAAAQSESPLSTGVLYAVVSLAFITLALGTVILARHQKDKSEK